MSSSPSSSSTPVPPPSSSFDDPKGKSKASPRATSLIVIGMAGSGKTTLMQRINSYLHSQQTPPYVVNLDPAVMQLPFDCNIDIRDTVDYQQVMEQYNLGPNGGIMTALNLFTTKFDQVLSLIENRSNSVDYVLMDTPGQIEIFTWSASGQIITDALASSLPSVILYVVDTPRTVAPATFMSNMLYACSILYKTRLPFILCFNKTDLESHEFALEWMRDFEKFQESLMERRRTHGEDVDGPAYMDSLMNSMSLVLDEFYKHLRAVGVSAMTGDGMEELFEAVREAREEFETDYKPQLEKVVQEREKKKAADKDESMSRMLNDMSLSSASSKDKKEGKEGKGVEVNPALEKYLDPNQGEEEDEDDDEGEIIDASARTGYYDLPSTKPKRGTVPSHYAGGGGGAGTTTVEGEDGTVWPAP
ncbi:GTPase NPA3 [Sporobolomyces salmoneus]|uniref:GTPase NPA3 n=1 Tax=Sporobolomyces salmoneus TaxID=183962 RepID=UPI003178A9AB